jgi:23S rRNA (uridine2552-2'-O)-methyltransferase
MRRLIRTVSNWHKRQSEDHYVKQARILGYRCRSAFKLQQIDDKYHFLRKGAAVLDLGCAPGSWLQLAV